MGKVLPFAILLTAVFVGYVLNRHKIFPVTLPTVKEGYFGPDHARADDKSIKSFKVHVDDSILDDLKNRLNNTNFKFEPLEQTQFQYGVNVDYFRKFHSHWLNVYNWRKWEKELNKFDQYKTQIEGLNVHYLHVKPPAGKYDVVRPLLLVHGWPGSIYEFHKILPMLTDPQESKIDSKVAFEVIAPSIPGYAWSDAPRKKGFGPIAAARVFARLMERLNHKRYYCQGGDWGSLITTNVALMFPDRVVGLHTNMPVASPMAFPGILLKQIIGALFPSLVLSSSDYFKVYPMGEKFLNILQESGYFHIQSTKPDTVGFALQDSPMGLATYIIEKFSTWTNPAYRDMADGGLTRHFSMDELLTNVMIYWTTGSIATSQRFYKESFLEADRDAYDKAMITVPTGIASFPYELFIQPKSFLEYRFRNITHFTDMPRGGHFGAFEEPRLLAVEIHAFVATVEHVK